MVLFQAVLQLVISFGILFEPSHVPLYPKYINSLLPPSFLLLSLLSLRFCLVSNEYESYSQSQVLASLLSLVFCLALRFVIPLI